MTAASGATSALSPKQIGRFYEPLVLYEALSEACKSQSKEADDSERDATPVQLTARDRFERFVYKLAYICASNKGPDTVTSFAVLQNDLTDEIVLVFGANQISAAEGLKVKEHVRNILSVVSRMEALGTNRRAAVRRAVLEGILIWNRGRIEAYLKEIAGVTGKCRELETAEHHEQGIEAMLGCFERCLPESFPKGEEGQAQYLQVCVEALSVINRLTGPDFKSIGERSKGHMAGSQDAEAWSGLLHCISRLKAYDQAVDYIMRARSEWPEIFNIDRLIIHHIPSSKKMPHPLGRKKSRDAASCIGRMTNDESIKTRFQEFCASLQKFELNERIKGQCMKDTFRPFVHSEVLVYDWLTTHGRRQGLAFFQGWKYIGASKPTCKLCDYFFDAVDDDIGRRPCHGNVYVNWRLPDGYGVAASDSRSQVYFNMNTRIRDDAFKILTDKCATGKSHDSDTYSYWPARQTEAESTQTGDVAVEVTSLSSMLASILSFGSPASARPVRDEVESVRGEASDGDD